MPYENTEGWSGSSTSRDRAEHERDTGAASKRQRAILTLLHQQRDHGATWKDVSDVMHVHHGSASASLTNLHKAGRIVRTDRKRLRSKVYVLPEFVRPGDHVESYHPNRNAAVFRAEAAEARVAVLEDRIERAFMSLMQGESSAAMSILSEEP